MCVNFGNVAGRYFLIITSVNCIVRVGQRRAQFFHVGKATIDALPVIARLSASAACHRLAVVVDTMLVEQGQQVLVSYEFAFALLDFDTSKLPVPIWDGCRPYDKVPVQFSCHALQTSGEIQHYEWLASGADDPRPAHGQALVDACQYVKTVLAYNACFERRCIQQLAACSPRKAKLPVSISGKDTTCFLWRGIKSTTQVSPAILVLSTLYPR
jgi:hypothetical protein